ncbi:MAG: DUF3179 domain-containing protein [Chloroflexi bacterium]|nr:DUF3179 domain-containing protein [Chloroflexota bacterium]MCH8801182.1 DUF3179 domain-containing protein [Chloroflexota bacterium]MCI0789446.1 DUF3179 domain-containing protein [Chloroflexota bacterium]
MVYAREIDGKEHTFGVSGKLIMNALVMYDHQSDTLWSQFLSRGVKGPLANRALEIVPAVQTTWEQWLNLHPDTLVLDKRGSYGSDTYEGYYRGGSAGIIGESNKDRRLPKKELVMGMVVSGFAKAYPFSAISQQTVINDHFAGEAVVITFEPTSESGAAFQRRLNGKTLTFEPAQVRAGVALMRDQETGSLWQVLTGQAVEGPLFGERLERLPSHYSFWFAWSDFHPQTELYELAAG